MTFWMMLGTLSEKKANLLKLKYLLFQQNVNFSILLENQIEMF